VWEVNFHADVEAWFLAVCRDGPVNGDLVSEAIDLLAEQGSGPGQTPGGTAPRSRWPMSGLSNI
jgi:hypothetical protein